jgi:hypothetical protein
MITNLKLGIHYKYKLCMKVSYTLSATDIATVGISLLPTYIPAIVEIHTERVSKGSGRRNFSQAIFIIYSA